MTSPAGSVNQSEGNVTAGPETDYPRVLHVDTSTAPEDTFHTELWQDKIDYRFYQGDGCTWRRLEELFRIDFMLARRALALAPDYDIVFCGSEKVAIPLALLGCPKPVLAVVHNVAQTQKAALIRLLGVARRWAKVGVFSDADARFVVTHFGCKVEDIFSCTAAPLEIIDPGRTSDGPLFSAGAAMRDYTTLVAALKQLPQCHAQIVASSRYDRTRHALPGAPAWVSIAADVPHPVLLQHLTRARFVVVPLHCTTQHSAGCTAILEGMSAAKAVIATSTAGSVDYVQDGRTGLLVPPRDPAALRDAIRRLWENPDLAQQMGRAGRALVETRYHPTHVTDAVRATIRQAHVEASPARAR